MGENPILDYLKLPHDAHTASLFYRMSKQMLGDTCDNLKLIWQRDLGIDIEDNHGKELLQMQEMESGKQEGSLPNIR